MGKERRPRPNPNRKLRRALSLKMVTATGDLIDIKSPRGSPNKKERRREAIGESLLIAGSEKRNEIKSSGINAVGDPFMQAARGVPTAHERQRRKTLRRCLRAVDGLSSYLEDDQPASTRTTTKSLTSKPHSSSETTVYSSSTEDEEELDQRGMVTVKSVSANGKANKNKKKNKKWYSAVKKPLLRVIQGK